MTINEQNELKIALKEGKNESKFSILKYSKNGVRCPIKLCEDNLVYKSSKGVSFGVSRHSRDCKNRPKQVGNFLSQQIYIKSKNTYISPKSIK